MSAEVLTQKLKIFWMLILLILLFLASFLVESNNLSGKINDSSRVVEFSKSGGL